MKRLVHIALLCLLVSCNSEQVERVVKDEKLKTDSESVAEDLLEIGEELIRDELNLPKGKDHAAFEGKE